MSEEKPRKSLVDSTLELFELASLYVRQQVRAVVQQSVATPLTVAGRNIAVFIFAFSLFGLAGIFLGLGLFFLLVKVVGSYIIAYFVVGILFMFVGLAVIRYGGSKS